MRLSQFNNQRGISIIIAVGFSGLMVLISIGLSRVILPSLMGTGNVETLNQAHFAAEGAYEDALYVLSKHGPGIIFEQSKTTFSVDNRTEYSWKIDGKSAASGAEFVIPAPGEGDSLNDRDKNWNMINVSEGVEINLFMDGTGDPDIVFSPIMHSIDPPAFPGGLSDIRVKLRTPCPSKDDDPATCLRPSFNTNPATEDEQYGIADDTILTWSFAAADRVTADKYVLHEVVSYDETKDPIERKMDTSTEIYESKIESVTDNLVLSATAGCPIVSQSEPVCKGKNQDGSNQNIEDFLSANPNIHVPTLKLTPISDFIADDGSSIPFLEYQIYSNRQIPDVYTNIIAEGYAGGHKQSIKIRIKGKTSAAFLDFAVMQ